MIFGINQSFCRIRRWPVGPFGGGAECLFCEPEIYFQLLFRWLSSCLQ